MKWTIFYDKTALPDSVPIEKTKNILSGVVAISSGSASVYDTGTTYIARSGRLKGNAPLLLDYEIAKRIEEAKKKK